MSATNRSEIAAWFDRGLTLGATHLIVVCDTFDHEDYPVYVMKGEDAVAKAHQYDGKDMQRVMEVYSLRKDKAAQLSEFRAKHYD